MHKKASLVLIAFTALALAGCTASGAVMPEPTVSDAPIPEETVVSFGPDTVVVSPATEVAGVIAGILGQNSGNSVTVDCGAEDFQLTDGATVECSLIDEDGGQYKVSAVVMLTADGKDYALSPRVLEDAEQ